MKTFTVSMTEEFYRKVISDAASTGILEALQTGSISPCVAVASSFGACIYNQGQITAGGGALSVSLVQDDQK